MKKFRKVFSIITGLLCVGLGFLGIVTPLLPTTPFLLLAALLFANASPGLHSWLHSNRFTGPYLKAYTEGAGMSRKRKVWTISILWLTLGTSGYFSRQHWWLLLLLGCIGIGVTLHIALLKARAGNGISVMDEGSGS